MATIVLPELMNNFREALRNQGIRQVRIILYGSRAEGRSLESSDIDVVVISSDFQGKGFWERVDILSKAILDVFAPIEAVAMTPEEFESGASPVAEFARGGQVVVAE